ncbi:hypothetical protein JOE31_002704 [Arthrobacter sp. PvP023]|nr:hypothetical protein [Arthrobacter sp. PvP023]
MPLSSVRKIVIMPEQFPPEVRDRAVRMTTERLSEYPSVYAAASASSETRFLRPDHCVDPTAESHRTMELFAGAGPAAPLRMKTGCSCRLISGPTARQSGLTGTRRCPERGTAGCRAGNDIASQGLPLPATLGCLHAARRQRLHIGSLLAAGLLPHGPTGSISAAEQLYVPGTASCFDGGLLLSPKVRLSRAAARCR